MRAVYPTHVYCVINGQAHNLPWGEFKLLMALIASAGRWMSRTALEDQMFGQDVECNPSSVPQVVHRLRARIGSHLIVGRLGRGYMVR